MKKSRLIPLLGVVLLGTTVVSVSKYNQLNKINGQGCDHVGYHYDEVMPSESAPGHYEFWACCKCHEVFLEEPAVGSFVDAAENQMTGGIDDTHPAYLDPTSAKPQYKIVQGNTPSKKYLHLFYGVVEEGNSANVLPTNATSKNDWPYSSTAAACIKIVIEPSMRRYKGFTSTSYMFQNLGYVDEVEGFEYLNTENVTDMSYMFSDCFKRTNKSITVDLTHCDTSKVTNFANMFSGSRVSGAVGTVYYDTSKFNMSSAVKVSSMFASSLIKFVDISTLDFSKITTSTNGYGMFNSSSSLKAIFTRSDAAFGGTFSPVFSNCSELHGYYLSGTSAKIGTTWDSSAAGSSMGTVCTGENQGGYFTDVSLKDKVMAL